MKRYYNLLIYGLLIGSLFVSCSSDKDEVTPDEETLIIATLDDLVKLNDHKEYEMGEIQFRNVPLPGSPVTQIREETGGEVAFTQKEDYLALTCKVGGLPVLVKIADDRGNWAKSTIIINGLEKKTTLDTRVWLWQNFAVSDVLLGNKQKLEITITVNKTS
ncbi:hypothetical protein QQ008_24630 [Fulvivirgaceae bacterium BMA10]|uniref:Lipoprotein n=1 Tax=Splendidivirga corallicola TaxID=3051826 RepID=A0ABT8KUZ6_9BACT|nr:hypothetical protein [Fulvivirgaceae bacterium BMA10]